jgi:hypothetical protein
VLPRSWALPLIMTGMNAIIAFACVAEQLQMQRSLVDRRGIVERYILACLAWSRIPLPRCQQEINPAQSRLVGESPHGPKPVTGS